MTRSSLANLISLPLHIERPMAPGSPITIGEPDVKAGEIMDQLVDLLHSTARVLQRDSYPDLGSFVANQGLSGGDGDRLIRLLLNAFEGFRDMYILDGQRQSKVSSLSCSIECDSDVDGKTMNSYIAVYILKKALFLVESISSTFSHQPASTKIPIPKLSSPLPILADNVIPSK